MVFPSDDLQYQHEAGQADGQQIEGIETVSGRQQQIGKEQNEYRNALNLLDHNVTDVI